LETLTNKSHDGDKGDPEDDEHEPQSNDGKGKANVRVSKKNRSKRALVKCLMMITRRASKGER